MGDLYADLGVEKNASQKAIKAAYRTLSKVHHPDHGGNTEDFLKISKAYKILSDKDLRDKYDKGEEVDALEKKSDTLIQKVLSVFQEALTSRGFVPDHTDLFKTMREICNQKDLNMKRDIESVESEIRNLSSIKDRMSNAEIFIHVIDSMIADKRKTIERIEEEKSYIPRIIGFIENCEYKTEVDDMPEVIREYL